MDHDVVVYIEEQCSEGSLLSSLVIPLLFTWYLIGELCLLWDHLSLSDKWLLQQDTDRSNSIMEDWVE